MTTAPLLDRAGIAARLPHAGAMCLLDSVLAWTPQSIHCCANNQADANHPLRLNGPAGYLPAASAIEYAAQATALHAALLAGPDAPPRPGFLASARRVALHVARLDDQPGALHVHAQCTAAAADQAVYEFQLRNDASAALAEGRLSVVLNGRLRASEAAQ